MGNVLDLWFVSGNELSGGLLLNGAVSLRDGVLWSTGSWVCGCKVSALLKVLLVIPCLMIFGSPLDRPLRDEGLLEDGRELS